MFTRPHRPTMALVVAVSAISTAAILVRLAPDAHPVSLAFWRTLVVALLLAPGISSHRRSRPSLRDLGWTVLAGGLLAAHFWAWFTSLHHTSVLRSTLLVCLTPIWAGLMEWAWGRGRPSRRYWAGIAVALAGVMLMLNGPSADAHTAGLRGDGLALLGGVLSAAYLVVGGDVRKRVGIAPYGAIVCGACALWLLPAAFATGAPLLDLDPRTWLVIGAMALGPQLLGHVGLNYAVGYLPAAIVTAAVLLEPLGAAILGALLLHEIPTAIEAIGGTISLIGVGAATWPSPSAGPGGHVPD